MREVFIQEESFFPHSNQIQVAILVYINHGELHSHSHVRVVINNSLDPGNGRAATQFIPDDDSRIERAWIGDSVSPAPFASDKVEIAVSIHVDECSRVRLRPTLVDDVAF